MLWVEVLLEDLPCMCQQHAGLAELGTRQTRVQDGWRTWPRILGGQGSPAFVPSLER